ncbi:MAG: helix-turn-helix domain-containing protein, partial [Alphaproteobacteria bacterium]|nr:helix-turn-helix domain-containing protein [Alphaproteobacteria bacterium]
MHIGRQISAARGLLLWNVSELAEQLGLTNDVVKKIESGSVRPQPGTLQEIRKIFGENGVEFTEESGVYLRPQTVAVYKGQKGLWDFSDNLYSVLAKQGGIFLQTGPVEETFMQYMGEYYDIHNERMKSLISSRKDMKGYHLLNSATMPDVRLDYLEYRSMTQDFFTDVSFYS